MLEVGFDKRFLHSNAKF